jgi:hypothetical protein
MTAQVARAEAPMPEMINGVPLDYGDLLIEHYHGNAVSRAIRFGNWLGGLSRGQDDAVHAAIYVGDLNICESVGDGLRKQPLNQLYTWTVWHHTTRSDIAELAGDIAGNMVIRQENDRGFGAYNIPRAVQSVFKSAASSRHAATDVATYLEDLENRFGLKRRQFFCSNYVVLAYSLASQFLTSNPFYCIDLDYETASPAQLQAKLAEPNSLWKRQGIIKG